MGDTVALAGSDLAEGGERRRRCRARRTTTPKMAPVLLAALCCSTWLLAGAEEPCDRHAVLGGDSVVPLQHKLEASHALKWRHGTKTVFYRRGGKVLDGAAGDVSANGSLVLRRLTADRAGKYQPEVTAGDGKAVRDLRGVKLCVLAPAPKPTVKQECEDHDVSFTCEVPKRAGLRVAWSKNGAPTGAKDSWTLERKRDAVSSSDAFACTVSNAADAATSEPFAPTCYKTLFPQEVYGISIWVFVGGGGGVVVVLIFVVIVCCVRAKRTRRMRLKEEGELRLEWTHTGHQHPQREQPSGHHHHHHHHQQQQQQQQQQQRAHHHHHQHQQQQPAGHTGPRPSRSKQQRGPPRPRATEPPAGHPQPSPRRQAAQDTSDSEQPPPLPQPRKKVPRAQRM